MPRTYIVCFFFFNDTATTEIYTLSLHDALPIYPLHAAGGPRHRSPEQDEGLPPAGRGARHRRSEPAARPRTRPKIGRATSELQSRQYLVCRLLLEKKNKKQYEYNNY